MTTSDADIAQQLQEGFDALNRGQLEVAAQRVPRRARKAARAGTRALSCRSDRD